MENNVILIGSGAREHAIALALKKSGANIISILDKKNPGIIRLSSKVIFKQSLDTDFSWIKNVKADLAVIGPEKPLSLGYADTLETYGIPVVGPYKKPAQIETSKIFARKLMEQYNIPGNPIFFVCENENEVRHALKELNFEAAIKPDGLTGGKGVKITGDHFQDIEQAVDYAMQLIKKDGAVIIEQKLKGTEFTAQAFTDGREIYIMPLVKDYKRAYDNDQGPNTGSMGAISFPDQQLPYISNETLEKTIDIMKKAVQAVKRETGEPYKGIIYGQFMQTINGPFLIEFNARFGDPEAMNVLSLLKTPFIEVAKQITNKTLKKPSFENKATFCLYVVPEGYPENPVKNQPIMIDHEKISQIKNVTLFYGSVNQQDNQILTTSSRTLAILTTAPTLLEARNTAYEAARYIHGKIRFRKDIGKEFL